ncbi:hypothetical protein LY76DRAFT_360206 [Colletotrichum caudatum]|nr:hypothetical protein LY76DRAFT_360206 [Colletotrichum caudatum]
MTTLLGICSKAYLDRRSPRGLGVLQRPLSHQWCRVGCSVASGVGLTGFLLVGQEGPSVASWLHGYVEMQQHQHQQDLLRGHGGGQGRVSWPFWGQGLLMMNGETGPIARASPFAIIDLRRFPRGESIDQGRHHPNWWAVWPLVMCVSVCDLPAHTKKKEKEKKERPGRWTVVSCDWTLHAG